MPKLDLTKAPITDKDAEARHQSAFDMIEEVKAKMLDMGLGEYPKPKSAPIQLSEITHIDALTNAQLGALYVQYVAYSQFIGARLADAEAGYKIAVNRVKHISAELTSTLYAKKVPKAEVPVLIQEDPFFQQFDAELVRFFAMKTLLEAHYRAYEKQAAALSRLVSLRELEFQQSLRQEGIRKPKARLYPSSHDLRKENE